MTLHHAQPTTSNVNSEQPATCQPQHTVHQELYQQQARSHLNAYLSSYINSDTTPAEHHDEL